MSLGVVITTCAGREDNLLRTLTHLLACHPEPRELVIVYDGCEPFGYWSLAETPFPVRSVPIPKHSPGQEQPRNIGVRHLEHSSHVWFLDSDLIFAPNIIGLYLEQLEANPNRILLGPYEFMGQGRTDMDPNVKVDIRWVSFDEHDPEKVLVNDLGAGLACFGGNLVWPIAAFNMVGGFSSELHHGRCEDGELGLTACEAGIGMSFVRDARAWHVWHPEDHSAKIIMNARDVPLLNAWHPWVQDQGLVVTGDDGARFTWRCPECGTHMNWFDFKAHVRWHETGEEPTYIDPASVKAAA